MGILLRTKKLEGKMVMSCVKNDKIHDIKLVTCTEKIKTGYKVGSVHKQIDMVLIKEKISRWIHIIPRGWQQR